MSPHDSRETTPAGRMTTPTASVLLQPSLRGANVALPAAPYSSTTSFACAFLGGPFAVLVIGALSIRRCRRWRQDAWFFSSLVLVTLVWVFVLPLWEGHAALRTAAADALGSGGWRYVNRAFSLLLFGLLYWRHRALDRAADLMGLKRPNGWVAGLAVIVGAAAVSIALSYALD